MRSTSHCPIRLHYKSQIQNTTTKNVKTVIAEHVFKHGSLLSMKPQVTAQVTSMKLALDRSYLNKNRGGGGNWIQEVGTNPHWHYLHFVDKELGTPRCQHVVVAKLMFKLRSACNTAALPLWPSHSHTDNLCLGIAFCLPDTYVPVIITA